MLIFCGKIASKKNYLASKKLSKVIISKQERMYSSFFKPWFRTAHDHSNDTAVRANAL